MRDAVFEQSIREHCGFRVYDRPGILIRWETINPPRPAPASDAAFMASAICLAIVLWILMYAFSTGLTAGII